MGQDQDLTVAHKISSYFAIVDNCWAMFTAALVGDFKDAGQAAALSITLLLMKTLKLAKDCGYSKDQVLAVWDTKYVQEGAEVKASELTNSPGPKGPSS